MSENLTLAQQIDADLKTAMLARDETAKLTLRSVKTALSAATKTEDAPQLDDALVQSVLQREAKRRRDAAAEYEKAGSPERAAQELAELAVLERYLPQQLTDAEVEAIVAAVIAETGATGMAEMGKVMSAAMPRVGDRADGKRVNQAARRLLGR
ncbi:MAG: GatB/YqeY domain-containing protein [Caldilineaceae bacterium]|nr:GatB/YqeY domain-containing protein [Caldilineaceae bacterium]MCB9160525.1 GatB/YqeY domain-containing protein [Caldilineaceae bacterium]